MLALFHLLCPQSTTYYTTNKPRNHHHLPVPSYWRSPENPTLCDVKQAQLLHWHLMWGFSNRGRDT